MGVGGQFCSRKEKQISGIKGLVLLRPTQGAAGASIGDEDWGKSLTDRAPSSTLSSSCKIKMQVTTVDHLLITYSISFFPKIQPITETTV